MKKHILGKEHLGVGTNIFSGEVQHDGIYVGNLFVLGDITLGEGSYFKGNLYVTGTAKINGQVSGSILAKEVSLESQCAIIGNVVSYSLSMQPGTNFSAKSAHVSEEAIGQKINEELEKAKAQIMDKVPKSKPEQTPLVEEKPEPVAEIAPAPEQELPPAETEHHETIPEASAAIT